MTSTFGIDFGTTNTRVAYFNGDTVRVVPFVTETAGVVYQLPTAIAYKGDEAVAVGPDALEIPPDRGVTFPRPLKWLFRSPEPVELGTGATRDPVDVVADFLRYVRYLVGRSLPGTPLDAASVTIPVHYPADARRRLAEAFDKAGIRVAQFFFEPIAAIYAGAAGDPAEGTAAVFDWGGGSLDIATVEVRGGLALTRQIDGWHRGGTDFDRAVAAHAVNAFFARHRDHPNLDGLTTDRVLSDDRMPAGRLVRRTAELVKLALGADDRAFVALPRFLGVGPLNHPVDRATFADLIEPDLRGAAARLEHALAASGVSPRTLTRLFFSGGTCNLRDVRERVAPTYGERLVTRLRLPPRLVHPRAADGLDDIGNATAVGAALLAAFGAAPVFAADIGVRLDGGDGDRFHTLFRRNDPVPFGKAQSADFFVTNASAGVARLLLCDRTDPETQRTGRLLRALAVPIHRDEKFLSVQFGVDNYLTLRVAAGGRMAQPADPSAKPAAAVRADIPDLKLGFRVPPVS